ncbi:hypothetical protein NDA12_004289 [Ustilago hordei]|nr:hypothetical protein NDA15_000976 [Ustilago hordei]KAJ1578670.1 hypothetical protein NDA12_004289 [Ustilago hordei]
MSLLHAALASNRPLSAAYRSTASTSRILNATRCIASSSRILAQVQQEKSPQDHDQPVPKEGLTEERPQKLGKRARRALRAKQRQEDERPAKETRAKAKAEARANDTATSTKNLQLPSGLDAPSILKVKHVLNAADGRPSPQQIELNGWRKSQAQSGDESNPNVSWCGSLFRSHISLLTGFCTAPDTRPINDVVPANTSASATANTSASATANTSASATANTSASATDNTSASATDNTSASATDNTPTPESTKTTTKDDLPRIKSITSPTMTKFERMETQARVIFQAIREARERGIVDEDESFFYPYPEGVPPKDIDGKDAVWLYLGSNPEAWGRELPPVKDRWLEVLSLGLAKEISVRPHSSAANEEGESEEGEREEEEREEGDYAIAFDDLVEDFDLEDHERLEQLGDSIVNMSSRLLAYLSYPDVNEGSLTRLSNYPTQNNILALLFQECGLAARRDELRRELRKARKGEDPETEISSSSKGEDKADADEEKARLPLLIKRDADMFEAYAAAVFLSHGNNLNVVHEWLCGLFRPFQDQAYRFMVQRSEALARLHANQAAAAAAAATSTNLAADGLGIRSSSVDPSSVPFSSLFPDFARGSEKAFVAPNPTHALNGIGGGAFVTDEFLTVAARARRQREERMREELRKADREELMNMGWFRKGFLFLRQGFRQYVMGKDLAREEELSIRERVREQKRLSEKDRERNRAKERNQAGVSIRSTGSKMKMKINGEAE